MNLEYRTLLPSSFDGQSRVWVYQSSRLFTMQEALQLDDLLQHFTQNWQSHGDPVKGFATLFFGRFFILMADESQTGVSGCSTDSSVRMMKSIETTFNVELFNRQTLAFLRKDQVELLPLSQLRYAVENGFITPDTLFFNNLVQTKQELEEKWIIPVKSSWLTSKLPQFSGV